MRRYKPIDPKIKSKIVGEMTHFLAQAREYFDAGKKELAQKWAQKARKLGMKHKVKMPSVLRRQICKKCHAFLVVGKNVMVRTKEGNVVYHCKECKHMMKYRYR
tara:strand:- start:1394 stop:1705 length:312 start_codon:yes stop_codon:yes gene_type:complete